MKTKSFYFDLPADLIAQYPPPERGTSKLLVLNRKSGKIVHTAVSQIANIVKCGSLLVFNNSKVRKARIFAADKKTGALLEFLFLKKISETQWCVMLKKSRKYESGRQFIFPQNIEGVLKGSIEDLRMLQFETPITDDYLDKCGHIPLPPYIKRSDEQSEIFDDSIRYQNVFAKNIGSAAAPTAGLHWTNEMMQSLSLSDIETAFVTLHVGAGTFFPVRSENIEDHKMHSEEYFIDNETAVKIERAKKDGRKIIAVGTTALRTLESAYLNGTLQQGSRSTSIFIYGDYKFKCVDHLFTNFHTPESTLLMLVSSFTGALSNAEDGRKLIMHTYGEAIKKGYKFFSYGDAMLIV
ncbi:MAG: tRNA preQ1(34) S-adenosylmethionine ribosyltransferase-isomerase QueA [Termitinemataceae bacterium]|nr:MAG: tRNA preQ1(34) S-adenosylmethionine ribosyltransferase-isomerase QueA [Termitinemataceae bacterium]